MRCMRPSQPNLNSCWPLNLVEADIQIVSVQRIMQDRKRLRSEILAADRLIAVAEGDVRRGDEAGGQDVIGQAQRSDRVEIRKVLRDTVGEG